MSRFVKHLLCVSGLAVSILLEGCGGSTIDAPETQAASVRIEGCVVDQFYVPNEGVPVRVLSADGRTLTHAMSGRMGEFVVDVPPGAATILMVDLVDGERLQAPALDRDRVIDSCLVARNEASAQ